ncbi:MAG: hypothetical protein FWB98_01385 [Defluviitaleaceae bacterium]|nr:hypothetical protein [Defluviitaleaceae bacterium]
MKFTLPKNPKIYIFIAVIAGVVWGAFRPTFIEYYHMAGLVANLHLFADNFAVGSLGVSLLRNGHIFLLLWACNLVPKMSWAAYLLIYMRAMTTAFSVAMLVHAFGVRGLLMASVLNMPQNVLVLWVCAYVICNVSKSRPLNLVIISSLAVLAATAYEIYIAPWLFMLTQGG